ncbi:MAG TPA: hypothetical protein VME66_14755, partial [Candidatus Acidoferrales bacterium]|nr:hypothetical protein [Candidatus Acidoferrales bacterium]
MTKQLHALVSTACAVVGTALVVACSGGSHSTSAPDVPPTPGSSIAPARADAIFTISIPPPAETSAQARRPLYVSASTRSIKLSLLLPTGTGIAPLVANVTSTTGGCTTNSGTTTCSLSYAVPVTSDEVEIQAYDANNGTGNIISQQITTFTPTEGTVNDVSVTLDANPSTIAVTPVGTSAVGSTGAGFTLSGTSAITFDTTINDAHGTTLSGNSIAGSPTLSATSGTTSVATISAVEQNPYSFAITPTGVTGSSTITVTASPASGSDGLTASQLIFTVTVVPTLIVAGEASVSNGEVQVFTLGASSFTQYGLIPSSALGSFVPAALGFDSTNKLYFFDNNSDAMLEFPASELSETSGETYTEVTSGITSNQSNVGFTPVFSVGPDGTTAVGNAASGDNGTSTTVLDQLAVYAPGGTSPSLTRAFGCPTSVGGQCFRAGATTVLTNATGTPFGEAVALFSDDGTASSENSNGVTFKSGKVGIITTSSTAISGTSSSTCSVTCYELDLTNEAGGAIGDLDQTPGVTWNSHNQELVFFDNTAGKITAYPFSSGAFGSPTEIDTYTSADTTGYDAVYAVSHDGDLAVATADSSGDTLVKVYNSSHTNIASWEFVFNGDGLGDAFDIEGVSFLPNDTV